MKEQHKQLYQLRQHFHSSLVLTPIIGIELEFYLSPNINVKQLSQVIDLEIESERGENQYEIKLPPQQELELLAGFITDLKREMHNFCKSNKGSINFEAKPFIDDFGSSMHVHLNFLEDPEIEKYIQILCAKLPHYIDYCLPKQEDYKRLDHHFMAPTHICWGGNNRTTMIRIPSSSPTRLEHRLPSANADPASVFIGILSAIASNLGPRLADLPQFPKIYGNAFDPQYGLAKIESYI